MHLTSLKIIQDKYQRKGCKIKQLNLKFIIDKLYNSENKFK